jgi:hypothetical protein
MTVCWPSLPRGRAGAAELPAAVGFGETLEPGFGETLEPGFGGPLEPDGDSGLGLWLDRSFILFIGPAPHHATEAALLPVAQLNVSPNLRTTGQPHDARGDVMPRGIWTNAHRGKCLGSTILRF